MANLQVGSTGNDVSNLQDNLFNISSMYNLPAVDPQVTSANMGVFDTNLYNAVIAFQRAAGIAVDGIAGPETQNAIQKFLTGSVGTSSTAISQPIVKTTTSLPTTGGLFGNVDWKTVGIAMAIGIAVLVLVFRNPEE